MAPTRRQIRQLIREELSRTLREGSGWPDDDPPSEEGTGYEYLRDMPGTIDWVDGPVDEAWLNKTFGYYKKHFSDHMWPLLARDFEVMLSGERFDPDVVSNYRKRDGTGIVSRQTIEALVAALHGGR